MKALRSKHLKRSKGFFFQRQGRCETPPSSAPGLSRDADGWDGMGAAERAAGLPGDGPQPR